MKYILLLILCLLFVFNKVYCQQNFDFRVVLDTANNQTIPADLHFGLKVNNPQKKPLKWVYLFRLNKDNQINSDKNTSFRSFTNKSFLRQWKSETKLQMELDPLAAKKDGDSIFFDLKPLRPNKNYLLLAVDEGNRKASIESRLKKYLEDSKVEDVEIQLVPDRFQLPKELRLKNSEESVRNTIDKVYKQIIPKKHIKEEFENAKKKGIRELFRQSELKINLRSSVQKNYPGPFKFPIEYLNDSKVNDSSRSSIAEYYSNDFRKINGVITNFRIHGEQIIKGKRALKTSDNGDISLNNETIKEIKDQYDTALKNLQITEDAYRSFYLLSNAEIENFPLFDAYFKDQIEGLIVNLKLLEERKNVLEKIEEIINSIDVPVGLNTTSIVKTTFIHDFFTRSQGNIRPTIGFLHYFSDGGNFSGTAPYAGVEFLPRSSRVNTKFCEIRGIGKYFSLQVGVPILAQNLNDGIKTKHLVGNAFSVYTGIGINFGHALRFSYGPLWFRTLDDKLLDDPVFKTTSVHTFSITFNDQLLPLLKNIFSANAAQNSINP